MTRRALLASVSVPAAIAGWTLTASTILLLGTNLWNAFPWPEKAWTWWIYLPYWQENHVIATWLKYSAAGGFAVVAALPAALAYQAQYIPKRRPWSWSGQPYRRRGMSDNLGHAEWATLDQIKRRFPGPQEPHGGVAVGELYRVDQDRSGGPVFDEDNPKTWGKGGKAPLVIDPLNKGAGYGLMVSGSGGGKTQNAIVSSFTWTNNLVCIDPKGKLGDRLRRVRENMGQKVIILRPGEPGLNILDWIDKRDPLSSVHIQAFAADICADDDTRSSRGDANPFYRDMAKDLVACLLAAAIWDAPKQASLAEVREIICLPGEELKAFLGKISEHSESRLARQLASSLIMDDEARETWENVRTSVVRYTGWLSNEAFSDMVSGGAFRTIDLVSRPVSVFLEIPLPTLKANPQVARALLGALMGIVLREGSDKNPILFIVDEAAQLRRAGMLELARDTGREAGIRQLLLYQAVSQIREIWGKDGADAWFASASWTSFSAIADKSTADLVSELCGEHPVLAYSEGQNTGGSLGLKAYNNSRGRNTNVNEIKRRIIKPDELIHDTRTDEQFLITRGFPAMRMGRPYAFRRPEIRDILGSEEQT